MIRAPTYISRMARRAMRAAVLTSALFAALAAPAAPAAPAVPLEQAQPAQQAFDTGAVVLAAHPGLIDSFWTRTVLLAAPAAEGGHLGVILNRPTRVTLSSLFPRHLPSAIVRDPVYLGGPVAAHAVVALMPRSGTAAAGAVALGEQWQLAFAAALIDSVIEHGPNSARYFLGLVIWHPGELEAQVGHGLWGVHPASSAQVLRADTSRLWQDLVGPAHPALSALRVAHGQSGLRDGDAAPGDGDFFCHSAASAQRSLPAQARRCLRHPH